MQKDGSVVVSGRLLGASGQAPPTVRLLTYQLGGTITDASGKPVQGAVVITRTQDRDFWTHSSASDANGHYSSFFAASDETSADPVVLAVGVASGGVSYGGKLGTNASFKRLQSSVLNIQLGTGVAYTLQTPTPQVGAVYSGLVVGVTAGGNVVKPLTERWPDAKGNFSMTLPGFGPRQDGSLLGEPAAVLLALRRSARRRGRSRGVAVAARERGAVGTRSADDSMSVAAT